MGLIFGENRLATVKARTYCEILMLTKPALDEVLANFPTVARFVYLAFAICYNWYSEFFKGVQLQFNHGV